jgi:cobalt/nickel transport system permease protein
MLSQQFIRVILVSEGVILVWPQVHIPDGYLGPSTFILFYIIMIPIWFVTSRKVEKNLKTKQIPRLAFGVGFSFVIMMFNFPAPGGTTGHAVGAAILALTLGPWFGFLGVTGALLVQCLLFGDRGVITFAANSFNMALVMSFVSYYVYKLLLVLRFCLVDVGWRLQHLAISH